MCTVAVLPCHCLAMSGVVGGAAYSWSVTDRPGVPDTEPMLLPTPSLGPVEFEDFTERLLSAHRFCVYSVRKVAWVERWGRRGDKQDGIDFAGAFSDGVTAAWQCKRYVNLAPAQVRDAIAECTFEADEYYLVYSGEASSSARAEVAQQPGWSLVDRRGLGRLLDDLPLHKRREVVDATWGRDVRKRLLRVPGEDAFLSLAMFTEDRINPDKVLNDCGRRVGRDSELATLGEVLAREEGRPVVVLVTGPGGRGKTRLLVEALSAFETTHLGMPVVFASPGVRLDSVALGELPQVPAVVVVDDAHQDPDALAPLLTYARQVPGTKLVLAARPPGVGAVRAQIVTARFSGGQVCEVDVGELAKRDARRLVASLADGLGIPYAGREYFAEQAMHSPYVAVVAANLIRRGELRAPLAVDAGLREQVLARYQELALDGVDVPARRVLAVYAALGSVADDTELLADIARFCELDRVVVLRLVEQLRDRGVLVSSHDGSRVTPDVLADHVLEQEAAVGRVDTGFARRLWEVFGDRFAGRLVTELAELDWRLSRSGGAAVFTSVWDSVRAEIVDADVDGVARALERISGLTTTQPQLLIDVLEALRARLGTADFGDVRMHRVRHQLAELYGGCASTAPELLETALDALWALRRMDSSPTNSNVNHPERVIADKLVNLGTLSHDSYPNRILDRVEMWLAEPAAAGDTVSPLFAIAPLLAKDGHRTVQQSRLTLGFAPYKVNIEWARPTRDRIRRILLREATGTDLRRAGAAVRLLAEAKRPPKGGFGQYPSDDEVTSWEDDDHATIATLTEAAFATESPVIRRLIRQSVEWTADHATSLPLRHAALILVTRLDEHGDDLAELVVGTPHSISTHKTAPVPSIEELRAADLARAAEAAGLDEKQLQEHRMRDIDRRHALREAEVAKLTARVANALTLAGGVARLVGDLDVLLRQVESVGGTRGISTLLLRRFAEARPDLTDSLVREATALAPGPVDQHLSILLSHWVQQDENAFLRWLHGFDTFRHEVKKAVGDAYVSGGWANQGGLLREIHHRGVNDPDSDVRNRFLLGAHPLLTADPATVAPRLLEAGITSLNTQHLLEYASRYDGATWGSSLDQAGAEAVLGLIKHCGWSDLPVHEIAGGIATNYPELVLDSLATSFEAGQNMPFDPDSIADAFEHHTEILAYWLINTAAHSPATARVVADIVMCRGMTTNHAQHLDSVVESLDAESLVALTGVLNTVDTWPLHQPGLARRIYHLARAADPQATATIHQQIITAMRPSHWGWSGGVSNELNLARTAAINALKGEHNDDLQQHIQTTLDWINEEINRLASRQDELEND